MKYAPLLLLAVLAPTLSADSLTLRDGTVIAGHFVSGTPQKIIFQDHNGVWRRFDVKQVQGIDFHGPAAPAGAAARAGAEGSAERAASFIEVRTEESIQPEDVVPGRTFLATIVGDIKGETGAVVVPGGAPARIMVRPVGSGAQAGFEVELESVVIGATRYAVYGDAIAVGRQQNEAASGASQADAPPVSLTGASIRVPAETVLEFRLDQPLLLRQAAD